MNDLRGKTNNIEINIRAYLQFDGFYYGWRILQIESNDFYLFDRNLKIINTTAYADETADYMRFIVDPNILPDGTILKGKYNFHLEISFQDGKGPVFYTVKNETRTNFATYLGGVIYDENSHNLNDTYNFQSYIGKQSNRKEWVRFKIIVSKID